MGEDWVQIGGKEVKGGKQINLCLSDLSLVVLFIFAELCGKR